MNNETLQQENERLKKDVNSLKVKLDWALHDIRNLWGRLKEKSFEIEDLITKQGGKNDSE